MEEWLSCKLLTINPSTMRRPLLAPSRKAKQTNDSAQSNGPDPVIWFQTAMLPRHVAANTMGSLTPLCRPNRDAGMNLAP